MPCKVSACHSEPLLFAHANCGTFCDSRKAWSWRRPPVWLRVLTAMPGHIIFWSQCLSDRFPKFGPLKPLQSLQITATCSPGESHSLNNFLIDIDLIVLFKTCLNHCVNRILFGLVPLRFQGFWRGPGLLALDWRTNCLGCGSCF